MGLLAAALGASAVLLTDYEPEASCRAVHSSPRTTDWPLFCLWPLRHYMEGAVLARTSECGSVACTQPLLPARDLQVLSHLASNAALNGLQRRCSCARLDWSAPEVGLAAGQRGRWRLVLAADVLYASAVVQPFINTLRLALHPHGGCPSSS